MSRSPTTTEGPQPGTPTYRVFYLDHAGAVRKADVLQAADDDEAKAIAATLPNGHGIDLWERARFLASYPPREATVANGDADRDTSQTRRLPS